MDMNFHWIQDRILQRHFNEFWKPNPTKLGDYQSKNHQEAQHIQVRGVLTSMNHLFHKSHCKGVLNTQTVKLPV